MAGTNSSSFDHARYEAEALLSKEYPLPRKLAIDGQVEVFALPGHEFESGRYVLSLTSCAAAVGKAAQSISDFCKSKRFKSKWGKGFQFQVFTVEGANKPASGIPLPIARLYWLNEAFRNSNPQAEAIIDALTETSLETICDAAFGVNRDAQAYADRFRQLLYTPVALEYKIRFRPEYYEELYRVLPYIQRPDNKYHRPPLFGRITREKFYALMPGKANEHFDQHNPGRLNKNHQYLTQAGLNEFDQTMFRFLGFLNGLNPGNYHSFEQSYRSAFTSYYQIRLL